MASEGQHKGSYAEMEFVEETRSESSRGVTIGFPAYIHVLWCIKGAKSNMKIMQAHKKELLYRRTGMKTWMLSSDIPSP